MSKNKTQTTELTKTQPQQFMVLDPESGFQEALAATMEAGETYGANDLIRVKTPSGGNTQWTIPKAGGGEENVSSIVGALVHTQKCAVLWPSEEMGAGNMPVLRSFDPNLAVADQVCKTEDIPAEMRKAIEPFRVGERQFRISEESGFPYSQWGSGKGGVGKRLKEQRLMFVLRPEDIMPMVFIIQPGSLKEINEWFKRIPMVDKVVWWHICVELSLVKDKSAADITFSRVIAKTHSIMDPETSRALRSMWGEQLRKTTVQLTDLVDGNEAPEPVAAGVGADSMEAEVPF